ncbi:MAG: acyl-CoA thioesterase II [Hyphomicrobiales bacterium]|nr:acyl-CoA thioesterase II [Hyphomicrobiales bacterium]PCJ94334.1 MAG: acyl-CoA thioesterase II [Hyphomicrobiales bacterium]
MPSAVEHLLEILDLEEIAPGRYRGQSPQDGWQRVYGGQVLGQALVAASRTVDRLENPRFLHSLHAYFLRPGDPATPILYEVDIVRDGRSFSTRQVRAIQNGKQIYMMSASFQTEEVGMEHQIDMPDVPMPEELMGEQEMRTMMLAQPNIPEPVQRYWQRERPIEFRPVNLKHYVSNAQLPPQQHVWLRMTAPLPNDPALQKCALAYMSDMTLLDTSLFAHGKSMFSDGLQMASLDHAMWFHRPFIAHEWMLYTQDSPSTSNARGFCRGSLYSRNGELIASVTQEGLIRRID